MGKKAVFCRGNKSLYAWKAAAKWKHYFRKKEMTGRVEMSRRGKTVRATGRGPDFYFQPPAAQGAE